MLVFAAVSSEEYEARGIHEALGDAAEEPALQGDVRPRLLVGDQAS